MRSLRVLPTSRLLGLLAAVALGAGSLAVAAIALGGGGPVPPAKPLAVAIHDALSASSPQGVTASISLTNTLLDPAAVGSSSPLLSGAGGRLWAAPGHLRLELQTRRGDTEIVVSDRSFSLYDVASNTVYRGTLPAHSASTATAKPDSGPPTVAQITRWLQKLMGQVNVSGAIPGDVAGHAAYTVQLSPKHDGGLLGSIRLAWDATHGVPLRFAVYAAGTSSPVLGLTATDITFGPVAARDLVVTPPAGVRTVQLHAPQAGGAAEAKGAAAHRHPRRSASGIAATSAGLPFALAAPAQLAGLPRTDVRQLNFGGSRAALVTYGRHLGAILVLERPVKPGAASALPQNRDNPLPTITVNGATATEITTALGTLVRFERGGVSYTLVGSVPARAAETAARGL